MDWFETLTGFTEGNYTQTKARLELHDNRLRSTVNGKDWGIGRLETPTLAQLRNQAMSVSRPGQLRVQAIEADAKQLHVLTENQGALFQVASQFNLLEMTHYSVTPEDGVTRYGADPTQGPACAIAAGAATLYRNYYAPVDGQTGQTADRQINTLSDLLDALGPGLIDIRNGYVLSSSDKLAQINQQLDGLSETELDELRQSIRIGLHWDVEVTAEGAGQGQLVSQAFCSALPIAYNSTPQALWKKLATLVLEAAYEATLSAALVNAHRSSSQQVYLTLLGGGVFGNPRPWILQAIDRALTLCADKNLSVFMVSYGGIPQDLRELASRHSQTR